MLKFLVADTDDDDYRPSKRTRADFRTPNTPGSMDDTDGMPSSPGRSQRGNSRDDIPTTDQTDDDPYGVCIFLKLIVSFLQMLPSILISS